MSDNIPFEIQMDIVQRIPDIKSLIQFRSVSKAWKSVIDSKDFVAAHTLRHTHVDQANRHHLLIRTKDCENCKDCTGTIGSGHCDHCNYTPFKYFSIVDDDSFPHQKVSVFVPDSVKIFSIDESIIIGTCHGLFCLYERGRDAAVIWNPSIRKTVAIPVPDEPENSLTIFGFGVCPSILDPKLVKITYVLDSGELEDVNTSTQVEVFTLSSGGTWRSPLSSNLPRKSIRFGFSRAVVDGVIYWHAVDSIDVDDDNRIDGFRNLIVSFDLTSEEFTEVNLPDPLQHNNPSANWI